LFLLASALQQHVTVTRAKSLVYHRQGSDINFLLSLADLITTANPELIVYLSSDDISKDTDVLTATKSKAGPSISIGAVPFVPETYTFKCPLSGVFVLAGSKDRVEEIKVDVLATISGRGGGKPGRLQGVATALDNIESVRTILIGRR
jgi:hypothetical protein